MLSIGIVGLPNVGKSTLFNALTRKSVAAENFPFCTIDPSVGIVAVPDDRLDKLAQMSDSVKVVPAAIEFVDIAGLVKGASEGEGLGNKFLSNIREVDAIAEVVRVFDDENITHVAGNVDPISDIKVINLELILADLETVNKRLGAIEKKIKAQEKGAKEEKDLLEKLKGVLEGGHMANTLDLKDENEEKVMRELHLLTSKPILYVLNSKGGEVRVDVVEYITNELKSHFVVVDAATEHDLSQLEGEDKSTYRAELGVSDDGVNSLIRESYKMLGLITYFTTGKSETRGWTIRDGSTAPEAGAAIHTDFQTKFIRADVIDNKELLELGSWSEARAKGKVQTVGKEHIIEDGDVVEFKI